MKCEETEILISAYIDGEVTESEKHVVEEHLRDCEDCQTALSDFSEIQFLYDGFKRVEAPKGFRQRVTQRLDTEPTPRFGLAGRFSRLVYGFSFALLIVLCGIILLLHTLGQPPGQQTGGELATPEINVYAEDILFGQAFDQDIDVFSFGEGLVAEEILETIEFDEVDTSFFTPEDFLLHNTLYRIHQA